MAFGSFAQVTMGGGGNAAGAAVGQPLPILQTGDLGFLSVAGDARIRFTNSWPQEPAPSASLLSIASKRGLVAAAGPDYIAFATTDSVRKAFEAPKEGDSDIRSYEPQLKISMPMHISQVAFTADENYLILSAESGGGLAVYEVQSLLQGSNNSAFELPTNGESLRALAPNPTPEKAELCAIVTQSGELFMANLRERQLSNSLKSQVTCVSWSAKGKQLCAGLGDGSIHQMTPDGQAKAEIPKPPGLDNCYATSITWLENNLFLSIHCAIDSSSSLYHIITREPPSSFQFCSITDPVESFGPGKAPHHTILRLRNFDPDLQDLLMVSSSASAEIGLLTRSKKPLMTGQSTAQITGVFTTTELLDDTRRPVLPMTESMDESIAVGVALDLSGKEKVYRPIPSDEEIKESPSPLPGLWVLTHEGILSAWWLVYNDSIKQGTTYSGLAIASDSASMPPPTQPATTTPTASPFTPSKFSALGSSLPAGTAFGTSPQLAQRSSPWGSAGAVTSSPTQTGGAAFGQTSFGNSSSTPVSTFGKPSSIGFGQSSQLGMRSSPWNVGGGGGATPAFGQTGFSNFANQNKQSPFGSAFAANSNNNNASNPEASASSGFSGFATNSNGFASASNNAGTSVFSSGAAAKPSGNSFALSSTPTADNPFAPKEKSAANVFGSTPFKLESSFKPDPAAQKDAHASAPSGSMFGSAFDSALASASLGTDSSNTAVRDADMDDDDDDDDASKKKQEPPNSIFSTKPVVESTTPATTPAPNFFGTSASSVPGTSYFDQPTKLDAPFSGGSLFGNKTVAGDTKPTTGLFTQPQSKAEQAVKVKSEEPEPPLPPDATSKAPYPLGESTSSSTTASSASEQLLNFKPSAKPTPEATSSSLSFLLPSMSKSGKDNITEDAPLPPFTPPKKDSKLADDATPSPPLTVTRVARSADDAPLPPFTALKNVKPVEDIPLPPFETGTAKPAEPAPLPPFITSKAAKPVDPISSSPFSNASETTRKAASPEETSVFKTIKQTGPTPAFVVPVGPPSSDSEEESEFDEEEEEEEEEEVDEDAEDAEDVEDVEEDTEEVEEDIEEVEEDIEEVEDAEIDEGSEGSGIDVAKDLSSSTTGLVQTPRPTPQSLFGGMGSTTPATAQPAGRTMFGEVGYKPPVFGRLRNEAGMYSPSPRRGAILHRITRSESSRSFSVPGMASQIIGSKSTQSHLTQSITSRQQEGNDSFLFQQRKLREEKEAAESRPLVDEEDEEIQKILMSEVQGSLELDEFIAHSNVAQPAEESIAAQVEAVYRDINSMIDTLGLNGRAVKSFIKGHTKARSNRKRNMDDLEIADDWVLCEIDDLEEMLSGELHANLESARVKDLPERLEDCQELAKDMHRLRAKQEDVKRVLLARMEPDEADIGKSLPLSAEQAAQQNELRREFTRFTKLLTETEEALTLLKARIASVSGACGKGDGKVPTVDAVIRTITKMTGMVEKRSGDIDVLETELRRMRLGSVSREGSPMMTPQKGRSRMFSPDATPSRTIRQSISSSNGIGFGQSARATPLRKKLSGFNAEEKSDAMVKRARRRAVLEKFRGSIEKRGVKVWSMEDV